MLLLLLPNNDGQEGRGGVVLGGGIAPWSCCRPRPPHVFPWPSLLSSLLCDLNHHLLYGCCNDDYKKISMLMTSSQQMKQHRHDTRSTPPDSSRNNKSRSNKNKHPRNKYYPVSGHDCARNQPSKISYTDWFCRNFALFVCSFLPPHHVVNCKFMVGQNIVPLLVNMIWIFIWGLQKSSLLLQHRQQVQWFQLLTVQVPGTVEIQYFKF